MNQLPTEKRAKILAMLCEGSSMRSIARIENVSPNTVDKLLRDAADACLAIHDEVIRNVHAERIQCDEIWSFCYAKAKNVAGAKTAPDGAGDVWTWTAIDPDSKLIVSWLVSDRSASAAMHLMHDLRSRLVNRVQLTTDGHRAYLEAVEEAFGADVDYAMLVKIYGEPPKTDQVRYSPARMVAAERRRIEGSPDPKHVSTSIVERHNLSIRMALRRFTRLTNGFSKKLDNHVKALALYFVHYNLIRIHRTLRVTPAMAAGVADVVWEWADVVRRMDEIAGPPPPRGPYRKRPGSAKPEA